MIENKESTIQKIVKRKKLFQDLKLAICTRCELVIQSPETNISMLKNLVKALQSSKVLSYKKIRIVLVASLCVVFKDIIPAYRIRPVTDIEKSQPAKSDTRKIRFFEENLLVNYKKYVELLQKILGRTVHGSSQRLKIYSKQNWLASDRLTALKCACQLLEMHPRFNYSEDLVVSVLPYLNHEKKNMNNVVLETFKKIFESDHEGDATLSICRAIHSFARKKSYKIRPAVATVLSFVPITQVNDSAKNDKSKKDRKDLSRRERKKNKLEKKHLKQMAECAASQSKEQRVKMNTLILNEILFVYFKILKSVKDSSLFSSVLMGLSVFAEHINISFVDSFLSIVNNLVKMESTSLCDGLNSIYTALVILSRPAATIALETDPTQFYNHLYTLLGRMSGVSDSTQNKSSPLASRFATLSATYGRSTTPAAMAVASFIHKSSIIQTKCNSAVMDSPDASREITKRVLLVDAEQLTDVMLSCINMLLIHRRQTVSTNRVLAFVKRLLGCALIMTKASCTAAILVRIINLLHVFPRCEVLFDSETEIGGIYRADIEDPERCVPASAFVWEVALLLSHVSPMVRSLAKIILQWGSNACSLGATEATAKQMQTRIGDFTLAQLMQFTPAECRQAMETKEADWSESEIPCQTSSSRRKRASVYSMSEWLIDTVTQVGLDPHEIIPTKKAKQEQTTKC